MKKFYEKPTLLFQSFAVDRIMSGTGDATGVLLTPSDNLSPLVEETSGGTIKLDGNNTLQSINYKDFTLKQ